MKFVKMGLYMVGDVSVKLSLLANRWVCIMGGGGLQSGDTLMWDYPHSSHRYSYILHPQVKSSHLVFLRWVGETSSRLISNAWCLWHFCPQIVLVIFGFFCKWS